MCANAATWYVDPNGYDGNTGQSLDQAFATIQHAIDMADDYDTVLVSPEVYDPYYDEWRRAAYFESNIDFKGKKITVDGSGETGLFFVGAIIEPYDGGRVFVFQSGETRESVLRGFWVLYNQTVAPINLPVEVSGSMWDATIGSGSYPAGGAIRMVDSSPTIDSCFLAANTPGSVGGAIAVTGGNPRFTNCVFSGRSLAAAAIYSQNSSLDVVNSAFIQCGADYGPVMLADGGVVNFVNNTVSQAFTQTTEDAHPNFELTAAILSVGGASVTVGNSVIWNDPTQFPYGDSNFDPLAVPPAGSLYAGFGGAMTAKSSSVQGSNGSGADWSQPGVTDGGGNLDLDLSAGPFPDAGSPLIDAGDNALYNAVASDLVTDIQGASRIAGGSIDIGCIEFVPYGNQAPSLTVPATAAVNVGSPVTVQATADDPDGDTLTYGLVDSPSWATIDPSTGEIRLDPPAGTAGSFTVNVQVSDGNGGSDQKSITVTVSPLRIDNVKATRKDGKTVIITFTIRNTSASATVTGVSISSVTLGEIATRTALPLNYATIKPGASKSANVQFTTTQKGPMTFVVTGISSAGPVNVNKSIDVP